MPAYAYILQRDGQYGVLTSWDDVIELRKQKKGMFVSRKFNTSDEAWTKIKHAMRPYEGGPIAFVDGSGGQDRQLVIPEVIDEVPVDGRGLDGERLCLFVDDDTVGGEDRLPLVG